MCEQLFCVRKEGARFSSLLKLNKKDQKIVDVKELLTPGELLRVRGGSRPMT